jgi:prepilin-type N-terminal cleavage/methylation domain-containing protein
MKHTLKSGFTLIEILVVVAIIGILAGLGFAFFSATDTAKAQQASEICKQIAVAFTKASEDIDKADSDIIPHGVQKIDTDICAILGRNGGYSVAYIDEDNSNNSDRGLKKNKNADYELKYGLLSPVGIELAKSGANDSKVREHLYHFVYDTNNDGNIDTADGMPKQLLPNGKPIAGKAAVWCWPEDDEARNNYEVLGKSW